MNTKLISLPSWGKWVINIRSLINQGKLLLNGLSETPSLDAELLLAHVIKVPRSYLHTWPEKKVTEVNQQQFDFLIKRRSMGEPLAYIVGYKEFWSLNFKVSPAVLIPRPETEILVEQVLEKCANDPSIKRILELGTGSGAIAISLATEFPALEIVAVDRSLAALTLAKENAKNLAVTNVKFFLSDWFSALPQTQMTENTFNIIVSNPPYIAIDDPHLSQKNLRFEPKEALISASNGLGDLHYIIQNATEYLASNGWLILEHGFEQGPFVLTFMKENGYIDVQDLSDLADVSRVTVGRKP